MCRKCRRYAYGQAPPAGVRPEEYIYTEMHFSESYAYLISTLPLELRDNTFEYQKLRLLIDQTVSELSSLGLGPSVLRTLHELRNKWDSGTHFDGKDDSSIPEDSVSDPSYKRATLTYEIEWNQIIPEPRLRLSPVSHCIRTDHNPFRNAEKSVYKIDLLIPGQLIDHLRMALLHSSAIKHETSSSGDWINPERFPDLIIPLPSESTFLQSLSSMLSSLSRKTDDLFNDFHSSLTKLGTSISSAALPESSSAPHSFLAHSLTANDVKLLRPRHRGKSDLHTWREIFRLYTEAQVFETIGKSEATRDERTVEEAEMQLELFKQVIRDKKPYLLLPGSKDALDTFMNLNIFILNAKKLHLANSEAIQVILQEHAEYTTLPISTAVLERYASASSPSYSSALITPSARSLPRLLVQAVGDVILPIIPRLEDYSCLICTDVAFRPIRLECSHLFCVRCLTKLQKRGVKSCPLCRGPTIQDASASNIDRGLLNFMMDWFPIESREKLLANEQEVTREYKKQFRVDGFRDCPIM